jgi:CubicO group peptidase (beta-lactamase class C family)
MEEAEARGAAAWTPERQIDDDEVLGLLKQAARGRFAPGTAWAYSNSGYVVLGLIAARAGGKPFSDVLRERIFQPLGMTRTLAFVRGANEVPERAFGHVRGAEGLREGDQSSTSATLGDGGVYSCVEDLAKWDDALRTKSLLTEAESKQVFTPARLADGSEPHWPNEPGDENLYPGRPVSYGFGWFLDPWQGRARQWHHGETKGFRSTIQRFPESGLTVVLLANRAPRTSLRRRPAAPLPGGRRAQAVPSRRRTGSRVPGFPRPSAGCAGARDGRRRPPRGGRAPPPRTRRPRNARRSRSAGSTRAARRRTA